MFLTAWSAMVPAREDMAVSQLRPLSMIPAPPFSSSSCAHLCAFFKHLLKPCAEKQK